ncbi:MAG: hypothetical protein MUF65_11550 [Rubritepida sp.]|jgi:hypothetical protein|nr:hypothetical protein [Rubritepida sp.]MCU0945989.1 hypothetical protein [Rubritepida sp.]
MRRLLAPGLILLVLLPGCSGPVLFGVGAGNIASLALVQRTVPDVIATVVSGQDCTIVNRDLGLPYCIPRPEAAPPPPYCTRSIGLVDCWQAPPSTEPPRRGVADAPPLTPAQEANMRQIFPAWR